LMIYLSARTTVRKNSKNALKIWTLPTRQLSLQLTGHMNVFLFLIPLLSWRMARYLRTCTPRTQTHTNISLQGAVILITAKQPYLIAKPWGSVEYAHLIQISESTPINFVYILQIVGTTIPLFVNKLIVPACYVEKIF
jgi:hypothetical protein